MGPIAPLDPLDAGATLCCGANGGAQRAPLLQHYFFFIPCCVVQRLIHCSTSTFIVQLQVMYMAFFFVEPPVGQDIVELLNEFILH